jgi:ATP-dependent Lon protease
MAKSLLPVLPLPYPVVLLPASKFTMPVSRETGDAILELMEQSDVLPVVAAIPVTNPDEKTPEYSGWATATRILRLVRPPTQNRKQPYLVSLHGLARVQLRKPFSGALLTLQDVKYSADSHPPSAEVVEKFKESALRLLDRLSVGSKGNAKRERYIKIAGLLDELTEARAPWMADVLVSSLTTEYSDKLGEYYFLRQLESGVSVGGVEPDIVLSLI